MKKILSIVAIGALFTSYAVATENEIYVHGVVKPSAIVGFSAVNGENLLSSSPYSKFMGADVDLGDLALGTEDVTEASIFVKTNATGTITMSLADTLNNGTLKSGTNEMIPTYSYGSTAFALGTAMTLTTGTNNGSAALSDKFKVAVTPTATQVAGTYSTTLAVTIAAN